MAKWTVALFGHWKPRYALKDKQTHLYVWQGKESPDYDVETDMYIVGALDFNGEDVYLYNIKGWEKRPEPGDIVAFKPDGQDWSENEKKGFLMVTVDGLNEAQMNALCETYFDLDSYELYDPLSLDDWYSMMYLKAEAKPNPQQAIALLNENKTEWYADYIEATKDRCRFPKLRIKSRRFHMTMNDLKALGVDEVKMLDKDLIYTPELSDIIKTQCYDKKNDRYVLTDDDLEEIQSLTDEELKVP